MSKRSPKPRVYWTLDRILAARGMTAYALAKLVVGVTDNTVYRAARKDARAARPTEQTLIALCEALECQPGDLLEYRRR